MAEYEVTLNGIKAPRLPSDPSSPRQSQLYFNTTSNVLRVYNGTSWVNLGSVFGQDYETVESLGTSSTTSSSYQNKLTLATGTSRNGTYLLYWTATLNNDGDIGRVRLRNDTDGTTLGESRWKPSDSAERNIISSVAPIVLAGVTKDIIIQWRDDSGGNSQTLRDARITIFRVL